MATKNQKRYGVFYRSNGRWTGPYKGMSFTMYTLERNPVSELVKDTKNYVLKSRIQFRPVTA